MISSSAQSLADGRGYGIPPWRGVRGDEAGGGAREPGLPADICSQISPRGDDFSAVCV